MSERMSDDPEVARLERECGEWIQKEFEARTRIAALESALAEAQRERDEARARQVTAFGPALPCPDDLEEHRKADYHQLYEHCPVAIRRLQRERDEAREELDRLRRALDLALKFDWMRGTGKAREGAE